MHSGGVSTCAPTHCPHQVRRGIQIRPAPTQSNNLNKSRELLAYIDEVKSLAKKQHGDQDYPPELTNWITWADNHAKELNPLAKGVLPSYKKATEILNLEDIEEEKKYY